MTVTERLLALADPANAAFTARLTPGVAPDRILGCRIPQLRQLARTLRGTPEAATFLAELPHRYYDENNLHGILLGQLRRPDEALADGHTYTVRFGVVTLLAHFLGERFDTCRLDRLAALPAGTYYIDMAVAWAFSVALVKHFDRTLPYFAERRLDRRVHNKALQKGCESLRIDAPRKATLRALKY